MPRIHNAAPSTAPRPDVATSPRLLSASPFFFSELVAEAELLELEALVAAASPRSDVDVALALAAAVLLETLLVAVVR